MRNFIKSFLLLFIVLCAAGCSVVRIQYGAATVTSVRLFEDQNLEGLKIKAPDGTSVVIDKKANEAQTEIFAQALAALAKSAVPVP